MVSLLLNLARPDLERLTFFPVHVKDSPHFKNEERKQVQTVERIRKMQDRAKALSTSEIAGHTK